MARTITQVYLDAPQKVALAAQARRTGRSSAELVREGVDAVLAGVNVEQLRLLDELTRRAAVDIDAMIATLDRNSAEHQAFLHELAQIRAGSPT